MRANAPAPMPPAPRPWITRKTISQVIDGARPHRTEAIRNSTIEARNIVLRLNRSPSLPQTGVEQAVARV